MRTWGERLQGGDRFYVRRRVHDEFRQKLTEKMAGLKMGNGLQDGVSMDTLVNKDGTDKVQGNVAVRLRRAPRDC